MARIAASLTLRGVSKSGSPWDSEMTFLPSAIMCRALVEIAMVRLGWILSRRSAVRCIGGFPADKAGRGPYRSRVARATGQENWSAARHVTGRDSQQVTWRY